MSVAPDTPSPPLLDVVTLRRALTASAETLWGERRRIDALNVYPVPDGDTGSNMSGTLREAVAAVETLPASAMMPEVLAVLAKGALYAARGNSGVILSQALRGFAKEIGEGAGVDGDGLARALRSAADEAYRAVSTPVEGTMLTVLRSAANGAMQAGPAGYVTVLAASVTAAKLAESRTIDQLPALTEAGVTDAGGEGICVILQAFLDACIGRGTSYGGAVGQSQDFPSLARFEGHTPEEFGFCTEFVLEASEVALDEAVIRAIVADDGNRSVIVVGDATALRVHVHADNPEALLTAMGVFGQVTRVKVEDMTAQFERFRKEGSGAGVKLAVLALSPGAGFSAVFESLGARIMDTSEALKPSAGEIAEAADRLNIANVIVLPNHKDVVPAALQAATAARCSITVVPTVSLPGGVAAALRFDPEGTPVESARAMTEAAGTVRTVEVTTAATSRRVDGVEVRAGQSIALVDGKIVTAGGDALSALLEGIRLGADADTSLVTLYGGLDVSAEELERVRLAVEKTFADVEVQALPGGQPLYRWIASVE